MTVSRWLSRISGPAAQEEAKGHFCAGVREPGVASRHFRAATERSRARGQPSAVNRARAARGASLPDESYFEAEANCCQARRFAS